MRLSSSLLVASTLALGLVASACTAKIATADYEKRASDYAKQKVDELLPDGVTIQGLNDSKSSSSKQKSGGVKKLGQTSADGSGEGSGEASGDGSGTETIVGNAKPVTPIRATPAVIAPPRPVTSWNTVLFGGGNGLSCASAVIITGAPDRMVGTQSEYYWLSKVYPSYKEKRFGEGLCGDKKTHVREITTATGASVEVIFDISSFAP
jgi:hypothetical protein